MVIIGPIALIIIASFIMISITLFNFIFLLSSICEFGPRVRLSAVLTNMPMIPDKPVDIRFHEQFSHVWMTCFMESIILQNTHWENEAIPFKALYLFRPLAFRFFHNETSQIIIIKLVTAIDRLPGCICYCLSRGTVDILITPHGVMPQIVNNFN